MTKRTNRRTFLKQSALAGTGLALAGCQQLQTNGSPNEKLDIGIIGAGGKGGGEAKNASGENVVALCDVDFVRAAATIKRFPRARIYTDYRVMLEKEKLDAVTVSTPDHHHFAASMIAMQLGKHVYCQKPLTHSLWEARQMLLTSRQYKVATQMGNQGTANEALRSAAELVRAGGIGAVSEVHTWTNRPIWPQGMGRPDGSKDVPATLSWDLWLGPAPKRPYHDGYCPFAWRGWWDFGTGALGDMACHVVNLPFLALELTAPTSVSAESSGVNEETAPLSSKIVYQFPAHGDRAPVTLYWYDGNNLPSKSILGSDVELTNNGSILVGDKGTLYSPGAYGSEFFLLPEDRFKDYKPPLQTLPRTPGGEKGHMGEWISACKGGRPAMSNFEYSVPLTEAILAGNLALRSGQPIEWDSEKLEVTNHADANRFVRREYRDGWTVI